MTPHYTSRVTPTDWILVATQGVAGAVLLARLSRGRTRRPPVPPRLSDEPSTPTTIVVACLNEAHRIGPLLDGVRAQGRPVDEILVVDSNSTDGTRTLVAEAAALDPRLRLETDPPLAPGWIGKAWALQHGATVATGTWLLGLDADTAPRPGLAAAVVAAAEAEGYDAVSFSPRFAGQTALERWLQPAILTTLVYRFGPAGDDTPPDRVMANGQCFLVKRELLLRHGGYEPVRASFAEDVSLARHLARRGAKVGFLDGSRLYDVRSYDSAAQMWREWGRSVDLKDASTPLRQAADVAFLLLVQGLPLPLLLAAALGAPLATPLLGLNAALVAVRLLLVTGLAPSYAQRGLPFWLSWLADPIAVWRVLLSSLRRPTRWRTREYGI
jgi:dolichol-phosphate mannosyltransferase